MIGDVEELTSNLNLISRLAVTKEIAADTLLCGVFSS
jgi:hypothetical protein